MNVVEHQAQPALIAFGSRAHCSESARNGRITGAEARPLCLPSVIMVVELPANLSAREISRSRVRRANAVVRVDVDVGEASADRID